MSTGRESASTTGHVSKQSAAVTAEPPTSSPPHTTAPPRSQPKTLPPKQNPALRALGLPRFRPRLPSRNWLIFLTVTGSFTFAIAYDRYQKRQIQRRWCDAVSHLAREPLPTHTLPRQIRIFLCAPPGDGLGVARTHFKEYVQPILTAAAVEWEVVEGRSEGEVVGQWAEEIRRRRRRLGEGGSAESLEKGREKELWRQNAGVKEYEGIKGDIVIGRNTWKEYIRGLHAGWLGLLEDPWLPPSPMGTLEASESVPDTDSDPASTATAKSPESEKPVRRSELAKEQYESATLPQVIPQTLDPVAPIPYPHILGFLNTPIRIQRFLNRRQLAQEIGQRVATVCLSEVDQSNFEPTDEGRGIEENIHRSLEDEQGDWPKRYREPNSDEDGKDSRERIWSRPIVLDPRLATRFRFFGETLPRDEKSGVLE